MSEHIIIDLDGSSEFCATIEQLESEGWVIDGEKKFILEEKDSVGDVVNAMRYIVSMKRGKPVMTEYIVMHDSEHNGFIRGLTGLKILGWEIVNSGFNTRDIIIHDEGQKESSNSFWALMKKDTAMERVGQNVDKE